MVDYRQEALNRMNRRGTKSVIWTLPDRTIKFSHIPSTQARNWDGTFAGDGNDPSKLILERMDWRDGCDPRYTNWW